MVRRGEREVRGENGRVGMWEEWKEDWEQLVRKSKERIIMKKKKKGIEGSKRWWDGQCRKKKKEVGKILKEWRRGKVEKEEYIKGQKDYRILCEKKKKKRNEELMKEAREAKTQKQIWDVINRKRRRKVEINGKIGTGEWDNYFRELLGGSGERVKFELGGKEGGEVEEVREEGEVEKGISWEEIEKMLRKKVKRQGRMGYETKCSYGEED